MNSDTTISLEGRTRASARKGKRASGRPWGSILSLLVAGFVLVSLPLIAAVVAAYINAAELSRTGEQVVGRSARLVQLSETLASQTLALERHARQYAVLGDPDMLRLYTERQQEFERTLDSLLEQLGDEAISTGLLDDLRAAAISVSRSMHGLVSDVDFARLGDDIERMQSVVEAWRASTRAVIGRDVEILERSARETRQLLTWLVLVTVPAAIVTIALFTALIARPLRRLSRAIRGLGREDFETVIEVAGPADVAELGAELDRLRERLRASDEEKQLFLRHMSHELKTPLTSLLEGAELLADGSVGTPSEPQAEVLEILRGSAHELRHLIENLLDYSAWQQDQSGLEHSEFDLQILLQQALDRNRLGLRSKNITVDQRIDSLRVVADRVKIATVFANLVSNAIKYVPRGGTIYLRAERERDAVLLDFADTGPNIPAEQRRWIFQPFYTGNPPADSHVRGSGVGLSLVSAYVDAHGGSIEVCDGTYPGAHFRLRLPLAGATHG